MKNPTIIGTYEIQIHYFDRMDCSPYGKFLTTIAHWNGESFEYELSKDVEIILKRLKVISWKPLFTLEYFQKETQYLNHILSKTRKFIFKKGLIKEYSEFIDKECLK